MIVEEDLAKNQRFLREVEQMIRLSNNEVIHKQIEPINTERMVSFAVVIAKLRAEYIRAAFDFADAQNGGESDEHSGLEHLTKCRVKFEEARDSFIALQRAIELGYMAVK